MCPKTEANEKKKKKKNTGKRSIDKHQQLGSSLNLLLGPHSSEHFLASWKPDLLEPWLLLHLV